MSNTISNSSDTPKRGHFLTLEGSEGVGKTTNLAIIEAHLRAHDIDVVVTREPGGTTLGERLRTVLLEVSADPNEPEMTAMTELLLMFAARAQHIAEVVEPELAAGRWVLSDRFTDASFAYQGGGRGVDAATVETLQTLVQGELRPDQTLYLDIDPTIAFQRIADRPHDRIEREAHEFFHRVRDCYLARARNEPERITVIDAGDELSAVADNLRLAVSSYLDTLPSSSSFSAGSEPS